MSEETKTNGKPKNNIFGAVLTGVAPSSNYRGETEANRTILQKLRFPDGNDYTVFSAETIRNHLREILSDEGIACNRSRVKDEGQLAVRYEKYPNPTEFADDLLFGFLAVNKRKDEDDTRKKIEAAKNPKDGKKDAGKLQELESKLKDITAYSQYQGDSVLRVNYAVSLTSFEDDSTMHQSPKLVGAFSNADASALIHREVHVSAYQYPFGLNLNDLRLPDEVTGDAKKGDAIKASYQAWTANLLRAIGELDQAGGNGARVMFPFAPVSIVLRLTARRTPDFDLYGYKQDTNESQKDLIEAFEDDRLPGDEFYIGGNIVRENSKLKALLYPPKEAQDLPKPEKSELNNVNLFKTAAAAIDALIIKAGLEEPRKEKP